MDLTFFLGRYREGEAARDSGWLGFLVLQRSRNISKYNFVQ